ncbi:MAG: PorT family protein [Bacteroidaceae bacterium]|nr:PorT family protein [Bacteroidaceae bacterium]MBQ6085329.1 PorT family protein [Bacteroidaceae bacterium]
MKKIFTLIVAMVAMTTSAMALDNEPEEGLTFQGLFGLNLSNFRAGGTNADIKPGFNLGARGEYMLPGCHGVFVNAGVNYTMKGAKSDGLAATMKARACYVEIPVHVGYRYNFSNDFGVYTDFGPYFALGINGKTILDYDDDLLDDVKTRFFRKDDGSFGDIQRFDFGLGFRVGAEYINHHSLTLGCDWGITDMYTKDYRKAWKEASGYAVDPMKNFNLSITYGYRF